MKKPLYTISVVSEHLSLHPQTIRKYERLGFLKPSRTEGGKRLYSDEDMQKLEFVMKLTQEMGINHAGVEMIIQMQEHISQLEEFLEKLSSRFEDITALREDMIHVKINKDK